MTGSERIYFRSFFMPGIRKEFYMSKVIIEKAVDPEAIENYYLIDDTLSLRAKGIMAQMLTFSDYWSESVIENLSHFNNESERTIYAALRELEEQGYLERYQERDKSGRLLPVEYMICDNAYGWIDINDTYPPEEPPQKTELQEAFCRLLTAFDECFEIICNKNQN